VSIRFTGSDGLQAWGGGGEHEFDSSPDLGRPYDFVYEQASAHIDAQTRLLESLPGRARPHGLAVHGMSARQHPVPIIVVIRVRRPVQQQNLVVLDQSHGATKVDQDAVIGFGGR
jgi:hypothetical protein